MKPHILNLLLIGMLIPISHDASAQDSGEKDKTLLTLYTMYDWKWTEEELLNLQYYIGNDVKLQIIETESQYHRGRNSKTTETTVYKKEIIIPKWTPGVAVKVKKDSYLAVDFGDGVIFYFQLNIFLRRLYLSLKNQKNEILVNNQLYEIIVDNPSTVPGWGEGISLYTDKLIEGGTVKEFMDTKTVSGRRIKK